MKRLLFILTCCWIWGASAALTPPIQHSILTTNQVAQPIADTLLGWDDTDNLPLFLTLGTGLSYDHATHTLSSSDGAAAWTGNLTQFGSANGTTNAIVGFPTTNSISRA